MSSLAGPAADPSQPGRGTSLAPGLHQHGRLCPDPARWRTPFGGPQPGLGEPAAGAGRGRPHAGAGFSGKRFRRAGRLPRCWFSRGCPDPPAARYRRHLHHGHAGAGGSAGPGAPPPAPGQLRSGGRRPGLRRSEPPAHPPSRSGAAGRGRCSGNGGSFPGGSGGSGAAGARPAGGGGWGAGGAQPAADADSD